MLRSLLLWARRTPLTHSALRQQLPARHHCISVRSSARGWGQSVTRLSSQFMHSVTRYGRVAYAAAAPAAVQEPLEDESFESPDLVAPAPDMTSAVSENITESVAATVEAASVVRDMDSTGAEKEISPLWNVFDLPPPSWQSWDPLWSTSLCDRSSC